MWACKNYDGDVQSDTVAQGTTLSVLVRHCSSMIYALSYSFHFSTTLVIG